MIPEDDEHINSEIAMRLFQRHVILALGCVVFLTSCSKNEEVEKLRQDLNRTQGELEQLRNKLQESEFESTWARSEPDGPNAAGLLVQSGDFSAVSRTNEIKFPRTYTAPPNLSISKPTIVEITEVTASGFTFKLTPAAIQAGTQPNNCGCHWRAKGMPK